MARVAAVVLAYARPEATRVVCDRLDTLGEIDEVIVVDGGPEGIADAVEARGGKVRAIRADNLGAAGRNLGVEATTAEYVLTLDDDSYPVPGAVGVLRAALESSPRVGAVGGLIRNVGFDGTPHVQDAGVGSFDWWLRAGRTGPAPPEGFPAFFFPEGGTLFRREAYLDAGGFYAPYFFANEGLDLATRLIGCGWDVRYHPDAVFDHLRETAGGPGSHAFLIRHRVRNLIWYFWLRFPPGLAARRIPAYAAFDLLEATARGEARAWADGVLAAWRERETVRDDREPLPRAAIRRAELNRGRRHLVWLAHQVRARISRR